MSAGRQPKIASGMCQKNYVKCKALKLSLCHFLGAPGNRINETTMTLKA